MRSALGPSSESTVSMVVVLAVAAVARAGGSLTDFSWDTPAGGTFESPINWEPFDFLPPGVWLGPPGPGEMATFDLGNGLYNVTFATNPTNTRCRIGDDQVTFNLNGHTYSLTTTSPASLLVPLNAQDDGALTLMNGILSAPNAQIAGPFPCSGAVTVGSGATLNLSGALGVGITDSGALNVHSGGDVFCGPAVLGDDGILQDGDGTAIVTGSGSTWHVNGSLMIGKSGEGEVTLTQNAGLFTSGITALGANPGATGTLTIGETLSVWTASSNIYVGGSVGGPGGIGVLTINAGGTVKALFALALHLRAGSMLNLNGGALIATVLNEGGAFNWPTGQLILHNAQTDVPGPLLSSPLVLDDAATVLSVGNLLIHNDGVIDASNNAVIIGAGSLSLDNGQLLLASGADLSWLFGGSIGTQPGTTGLITLDGAGTSWVHDAPNVAELNIGEGGSGTVSIFNGASLAIDNQCVPSLGRMSGSSGSLSISGAGSQGTGSIHPLYVGSQGSGTVTIDGGGSLNVPGLILGENPGGHGELTVRDAGSFISAGSSVLGSFAPAAVTISNGAIMEAGDICAIAQSAGSDSQVTVTGPGSQFTAAGSNGLLLVGGTAHGTISIADGAVVHAVEIVLGDGTGAVGTVGVSGADSQFIADELIEVGNNGTGVLLVGAGANVTAPLIEVSSQSMFGGGGSILGSVENAGTASPGLSAGIISIEGTYVQSSTGVLDIEIAGPIPGTQYDVLAVSGPVTLDGTLSVILIDGYAPSPDQTFTILTADDVDGAFAQVNAPMGMQVVYTANSVVLQVSGTPCPADLDGSGSVTGLDLASLLGQWSGASIYAPCPPFKPQDFNQDCKVNGLDLALLLGAWGACP